MSDQMVGIICFVVGVVVGSVAKRIYTIQRALWLDYETVEIYLDTKLARRANDTEADHAE